MCMEYVTSRFQPATFRVASERSTVMLAFHDADTDTYTDTCCFLARPRDEIACVGRKIVAVFGESVSVSASWNASITPHRDRPRNGLLRHAGHTVKPQLESGQSISVDGALRLKLLYMRVP